MLLNADRDGDPVSDVMAEEVRRLGPDRVLLVGTAEQVPVELRERVASEVGLDPEAVGRITAPDRYALSVAVAEAMEDAGVVVERPLVSLGGLSQKDGRLRRAGGGEEGVEGVEGLITVTGRDGQHVLAPNAGRRGGRVEQAAWGGPLEEERDVSKRQRLQVVELVAHHLDDDPRGVGLEERDATPSEGSRRSELQVLHQLVERG